MCVKDPEIDLNDGSSLIIHAETKAKKVECLLIQF